MTAQQVDDRVRRFLGPDSTDSPVSPPDLYQIMNECYLEYVARFTSAWRLSAVVNSGSTVFTIGSTDVGQWLDCETLEVWDGSTVDPDTGINVYLPLKRRSEGQILSATRGVGAVGRPQNYSLSLQSRSQAASTSVFRARVYPIPDQLYYYRGRIRLWPIELIEIGNLLESMDDLQAEQVAIWTAMRIGRLRSYPEDLVKRLAGLLPARIAAELDIHDYRDWPYSDPRHIGEAEREVA